jgi:hypothetical protein
MDQQEDGHPAEPDFPRRPVGFVAALLGLHQGVAKTRLNPDVNRGVGRARRRGVCFDGLPDSIDAASPSTKSVRPTRREPDGKARTTARQADRSTQPRPTAEFALMGS